MINVPYLKCIPQKSTNSSLFVYKFEVKSVVEGENEKKPGDKMEPEHEGGANLVSRALGKFEQLDERESLRRQMQPVLNKMTNKYNQLREQLKNGGDKNATNWEFIFELEQIFNDDITDEMGDKLKSLGNATMGNGIDGNFQLQVENGEISYIMPNNDLGNDDDFDLKNDENIVRGAFGYAEQNHVKGVALIKEAIRSYLTANGKQTEGTSLYDMAVTNARFQIESDPRIAKIVKDNNLSTPTTAFAAIDICIDWAYGNAPQEEKNKLSESFKDLRPIFRSAQNQLERNNKKPL